MESYNMKTGWTVVVPTYSDTIKEIEKYNILVLLKSIIYYFSSYTIPRKVLPYFCICV